MLKNKELIRPYLLLAIFILLSPFMASYLYQPAEKYLTLLNWLIFSLLTASPVWVRVSKERFANSKNKLISAIGNIESLSQPLKRVETFAYLFSSTVMLFVAILVFMNSK